YFFFFSSRRRHTRSKRDWSSDVCSSDLGMAGQKSWIVNLDPAIINAPFPDGYWQEDMGFETFLDTIERAGFKPHDIAGVLMESYQGVGPDFAPKEYVGQLAEWCRQHQAVLVFDEVQAGFGRTGKFWAF